MSDNLFSLQGRRALVVGCDSGIGLACARAIAAAGASLVMSGLDSERGEALAREIASDSGRSVHYRSVDVREEKSVETLVAAAAEMMGGLDIAMNNAGIPGPAAAIQDLKAADFDNLFAINVRGAWLGMKYQVPAMLAAGHGGSIVNLASTAALSGLAFVSAYSASKHAVAGLTKSAAIELAPHNIRVNAIAPGPVQTGLLHNMRVNRSQAGHAPPASVPMGRVAQPEEMAGTVVWLASQASSFVTGSIISVDGGVIAA
ncbi:3-oxoacyl-(acyl-carrier-protein) reductase [Sphingobium chlorophenolicum L-1]|uniref:3-oxoacyl-(Acyl-carrier-protein) reductase n=1 Tax=Sphingobium chlorophenolicum L-1 TaxID=690566 RepID=F6F257_SPHCR|nr:SDR family NAD(P)-dependent oxidoreductase [Sphingobium chlorophenolicum]AEG50557.1 3-oxoacyl-(acyl-carrier-protein) reductase [Sphingobium chlorophenolicum L-1]